MKEWFKVAVYSVLLVLLGVSLVMFTPPMKMATAEEAKADKVTVSFAAAPVEIGFMGSEVHQQAYLTYLVKDYVPESIDDWTAAFTERKKAAAEFSSKGVLINRITAPGKEGATSIKVEALPPEQLKEGVLGSLTDGKGIAIKFGDGKEVQSFELKEGAAAGTVTVEKGDPRDVLYYKADKLPTELPAEVKTRMELYQSFEQAVEAKDAAKLKELLPRILDDYKQVTQKMVQANEELKKNQ
jgi:hypothetical protein